MAKNLDLKQFMLEKGEKLALGVGIVAMVLLMTVGAVYGLSSPSPSKTATDIRHTADEIQQKIAAGPALPMPPVHPLLLTDLKDDQLKLEEYRVSIPNFIDQGLDNTRRLNPAVLSPVEWAKPVLLRAQVRSLMLSPQRTGMTMGFLIPKEKPKDGQMDPRIKAWIDRMRAMGANIPPDWKPPVGPQAFPGGQMNTVAAHGPDGGSGKEDFRLEFHSLEKMDKIPPGAKPAEQIIPYRMVIVAAAFPYRAQLDQFAQALRLPSIMELTKEKDAMPQFLRFNVQRRTVDAKGKPGEWAPVKLEADYMPIIQTKVGWEQDDANMKPIVFPNLVMARPLLAQGRPGYSEMPLKAIRESLRQLAEKTGKNPAAPVLNPLQKQIMGEGDAFAPPEPDDPKAKMKAPMPEKQSDKPNKDEVIIPEYCLVRFIDITVAPGQTYQYQIQIKMANPNFGNKEKVAFPSLAEQKELVGQWAPEDPAQTTVTVGKELFVYAHELEDKAYNDRIKKDPKLNDKDVAFVQMHKWLSSVSLTQDRGASVPVGDWVIGDVPVRRGEYMGRLENVDVAMWFPVKEMFSLASPAAPVSTRPVGPGPMIRTQPVRGIPVKFDTEDLLVDFDGGRIRESFKTGEKQTKDVVENANVEMLILGPDGKLRVRNSKVDLNDSDRKDRWKEWKDWIDKVRADMVKGSGSKLTGPANPFDKK